MTAKTSIEIIGPSTFAGVVADEIIASIQDVLSEKDTCTLVLSGGKSPGSMYRLMSKPPRVGEVDWSRVKIFWGDERFVPADSLHSNYKMAQETLLASLPDGGPEVFPVSTSFSSAKDAAEAYEKVILEKMGLKDGETPEFDIVLLGLGEDGYVASLFPGQNPDLLKGKICVATQDPETDRERITMTPDVLFGAKKIVFMVKGEQKADIVQRVLEGNEKPEDLPALYYRAVPERVTWFLDSGSALRLTKNPQNE